MGFLDEKLNYNLNINFDKLLTEYLLTETN